MAQTTYDYIVIGSGVGGILTAALLARRGDRVCVLERHTQPGGYGHSFSSGDYVFCAELHYLWNCGPNQEFGALSRYLGLDEEIRFVKLNPDGYDHLRFPSFRYEFVEGLERNRERLAAQYPAFRDELGTYFEIIRELNQDLYQLPLSFTKTMLLRHPFRFQHLIRYRNWTTGELFDHLRLPLELQSILAGQSGDLGLPPHQASLALQAAITCGYAAGAYVPTRSYQHLFQALTEFIQRQPGCSIQFNRWVTSLEVERGTIRAARVRNGEVYTARHFIYNGDPKLLPGLISMPLPGWFQRRLKYEYSASSFTLYLGVRGLKLEDYGFGDWNLWHYQHDDIDRCYKEQLVEQRLDDPMLFVSTPTLHHKEAAVAPKDCHQLVVCTPCPYQRFADLRRQDRDAYQAEKNRITEAILSSLERNYLPDVRRCLDVVIAGSPATNERFVLAPRGNAYGASLTPKHINIGKVDYHSPFPNLWLIGATAGTPSFAGGTHFARMIYEKLTGEHLPLPGPAQPKRS
jgi:all-trans-retinol 13,14-reductase